MKNILILGLGRFGSALVKPLHDLGNQIVVCDSEEEKVNKVLEFTAGAKVGDCTSESFIRSLGVEDFDLIFVTIGESLQNSLVAVTLLKDNGAKCIYAKAGSDMHEKLLLRLGANKVIFPERDAGTRIAKICGRNSVFDVIELENGYAIYEMAVPQKWIGKSLKQLDIRVMYGLNILGVKDGMESPLTPSVSPEYVFKDGVIVMVMGDAQSMNKVLRA